MIPRVSKPRQAIISAQSRVDRTPIRRRIASVFPSARYCYVVRHNYLRKILFEIVGVEINVTVRHFTPTDAARLSHSAQHTTTTAG
jgi:hypothetical protein